MNLLPENHQDAYQWASTLLAHSTIGLFFAALVGAVTRSAMIGCVVTILAYLVGWEIWWQAVGAGWLDAFVDAAAVASGAVIAWAAWERRGGAVAASLAALALILQRGIRRRS